MKNLFSFHHSIALIVLLLLSACAKRATSSSQALAHAQETYDIMNTRYAKLLSFEPMSQEAMQELRVIGVRSDVRWSEFFLYGCDRSLPIARMARLLKFDLSQIYDDLEALRKFNQQHHTLYKKLAELHNKILYIRKQLSVQKEYLDEINTGFTQSMLINDRLRRY